MRRYVLAPDAALDLVEIWRYLRFFAVYSYLIIYRPKTKPLQVVAILNGNRDVERVLSKRN